MKIGILKTDSVLSRFQPEFGDYPDMFETLLRKGGDDLTFVTYDVQEMPYPENLGECNGYLITGSKKSVYDDEPWIHRLAAFVRELHAAKKKTVGICFGHQMVAYALDGEVGPAASGWGVGVHRSEIYGDEPWMRPKLDHFNLLVSHKDQVSALPSGSNLLAGSEFCPFGMFTIGDHILTFQGHPEFLKGYSRSLMQYREETLGEETFNKGMASLENETHEAVIAQWIVNFIADD